MDTIAKLNVKPYTEQTVEQARGRSKLVNTSKAVAGEINYDGSRKELFIPLSDFTGRPSITICFLNGKNVKKTAVSV